MGILGKLKGGSQVLAKTAIANYVVEVESVVPVDRESLIRKIQDKCNLVDEEDFDKLSHDINDLCDPIKNQQLDYIDRAGNITFKGHKIANSPAKLKKAEEDLLDSLNHATS